MRRAWKGVKEQHMTQVDAAETFGVPRSTLQVYLKRELEDIPDDIRSGRFKPVFNAAQESQLVDDLLEFSRRYYAMSKKALVQSAFRLAEANHIPHPFKNGEAGYDWAYGFLKRNEGRLSIRTAQLTSIPRIFGFRKSTVYRFFDILESIIQKEQYTPQQIFNCDETGVTIVQSHAPKVVAQRGAKNVARIKAAERGSLVTMMGCASAGGAFVPPFFVFAGKKHQHQETKVALGPVGSDSSNSKRGWMVSEVFIDWLHHFVHHVQPTAEHKVLLIMDNLKAHITLEAIDYAREHFIDLLTMPPHTSHRLQPLDVGFFSPLKNRLNEAIMKWQNEHRYVKPNQFDIPAIIKAPYEDSAKQQTAMNAFSKTGIWVRASNGPNRHVINPDDFYPEDGNYDEPESSLDPQRSDSDPDDGPDSDDAAHTGNQADDEQEIYENYNSPPEQSNSRDDMQFTLETVQSERRNIPGVLTEEEDPTYISQNFLNSIIIFNSTEGQEHPAAPATASEPTPSTSTTNLEESDPDVASDSSRRTSDGSINSLNVQDYPLLSVPQQSSLPMESNASSKKLQVTLMDLDGPSAPVPVRVTSRHSECNLVTDQKYLEERRQKDALKMAKKPRTSKSSSTLKKKPVQSVLLRNVIATRKRYAALAQAAKAPIRRQPSRAVKK